MRHHGFSRSSLYKVTSEQALRNPLIQQFLLTCEPTPPRDAGISGKAYEQACVSYLAEALHDQQPAEVLASAKTILSNPMDLTVVAQMLAHSQKPDLFHLQEQHYRNMAADYAYLNMGEEFPLLRFSESIYQRRLKGEVTLSAEEFLHEIYCMEQYKMVLIRQSMDTKGNPTKGWHFRHDKIMEFFIVQTFLGPDNDRPQKHLGDVRFRGVYFLLAMLLPLEEAGVLREHLINYAADTKDHTVSDAFIQLLRTRKGLSDRDFLPIPTKRP